jgi:hypothetical protein
MAINYHPSGPGELFFYPINYASAAFLKLEPVPRQLTTTPGSLAQYYRGTNICNQNGKVALTNDQTQQLGNAIRLNLATGASTTVNGVQVQTHDALNVDIIFLSVTSTVDNDSAAGLAAGALRYVTSGAPPQPLTDGVTLTFDTTL